MVYCRECKQKVDDCMHFVEPLRVPSVQVFDPKVKTLAYQKTSLTLEITFKNGQVWQLFGVKPDIYDELLHATLSSFLNFLAPRYKAAPVRTKTAQPTVPASEPCPACKRPMSALHRTSGEILRILWKCIPCHQALWKTYATESVRERKR